MKILKVFGLTMYIIGAATMINCIDFSQYSENILWISAIITTIGGTLWGNIEARER